LNLLWFSSLEFEWWWWIQFWSLYCHWHVLSMYQGNSVQRELNRLIIII
jgi:hypothetical protein